MKLGSKYRGGSFLFDICEGPRCDSVLHKLTDKGLDIFGKSLSAYHVFVELKLLLKPAKQLSNYHIFAGVFKHKPFPYTKFLEHSVGKAHKGKHIYVHDCSV